MNFIFDPSLVLCLPLYRLDGAASMSKDAYGHSDSVTGAVWQHDSRLFDGLDDYINCGTSPVFNFGTTGAFTVEIWYWTNQAASVSQRILGKYDTGAGGTFWGLITSGSQLQWYCQASIGSAASIWDSQWHHIVALRYPGGTKTAIMVDAKIYNEGTVAAANFTWSAPLSLGQWGNLNSSNLNGKVGEFRIYSRALAPLEIQHNYLATKWRYR